MIKNLKVGMKEYELGHLVKAGFDPINTYPLVKFGDESMAIGLCSPTTRELKMGDPAGLCYSLRGNLTCRSGVLATSLENYSQALKPYYEKLYKPYFEAIVAWYETAKVGATGGQLHKAVMDIIGAQEFGVTLNAGHCTATEEWSNALSFEGSTLPLVDGAFMQVDVIASNDNPVRCAICEDAVVIAGEKLRAELKIEFPEVYERIQKRRKVMIEELGINLHDDVLPMSNLNGAYFPFLLNTDFVFAKK